MIDLDDEVSDAPAAFEAETPPLPRKRSGPAKVITVLSGKGGSGKSTLVCNLAAAIARDQGLGTGIIDLALQFGDQALLFDAPTAPSMIDLLANVDALSADFLVDCMHDGSGVRVLASPPSPELADLVEVGHIRQVLDLMRQVFDVVVIDTSSYLSEATLEAIEEADHLVCITTPYLASVKDTKLLIKTLSDLGIPADKLTIVLNRLEPGLKLATEVVAANIRFPVVFELPHSPTPLLEAATDGVPVVVGNKSLGYAQRVSALAQALTNDGTAVQVEKKRGLFGSSR